MLHGLQPVGDDDQGLALHQPGDGTLDHGFIFRIRISGGFVQDHHRGRLLHLRVRALPLPRKPVGPFPCQLQKSYTWV